MAEPDLHPSHAVEFIRRTGHDYYSLDSIDEALLCPVCSNPLVDPIQSPSCVTPHLFCQSCLQAWLVKSQTCPLDRLPIAVETLQPGPEALRTQLDNLLVVCSLGCGWHGSRVTWKEHLESACPEVEIDGTRRGTPMEKQLKEEIGQLREGLHQSRSVDAGPSSSSAGLSQAASVLHRSVRCDSCGMNPIRGFRYKCLACPDYDLCSGCYSNRSQIQRFHSFARIRYPEDVEPFQTGFSTPSSDWKVRHWGISCDGCSQDDLIGPRYQCTVCRNFDLCQGCLLLPKSSWMHNTSHPMIRHVVSVNTAASRTTPRAYSGFARVVSARVVE